MPPSLPDCRHPCLLLYAAAVHPEHRPALTLTMCAMKAGPQYSVHAESPWLAPDMCLAYLSRARSYFEQWQLHVQVMLLPPESRETAAAAVQQALQCIISPQPGQHSLGASLMNYLLPAPEELQVGQRRRPTQCVGFAAAAGSLLSRSCTCVCAACGVRALPQRRKGPDLTS